ncbi:hypothetical protein BGZ95_000326 [Linnemannia exigua]|uniref:PX domain-containing protein n=1 Tax=Linnemannia exigua TaxID=604196 RepID=A0AAD4H4I0_9FUNG|nr:hypothetical protein BGZ95_000326 [Linnemannia exigua]
MSETQPQKQLLTTSQEHYLKKYLLTVLINTELARLQKQPYETLPHLGGPFDLKDEHANSTTPFLRYLFESIVVPFPFLTSSRGALWPKLQLFMDEYAKIEAGNGVEREEMLRRKRLQNKGERTLVLMYSMAIKTLEQRAQEKKDLVARKERLHQQQQQQQQQHVSEQEQQEDQEQEQRERHERHNSLDPLHQHLDQLALDQQQQEQYPTPDMSRSRSVSPAAFTSTIHGVRVNVVGVRTIKEKRHVREHEHAEFIIASAFASGQEYVVARRHGRFRRLFHTLRQEFPNLEIPVPPAKYPVKSGSSSGVKTAREKDRISLRGYLHNIAKVGQEVVDSAAFISFLSKDAIHMSEEEAKDVQMRVSLDEHRMAQQAKFDREVAKKVDELDSQLKEVKMDLLQPGGVSRLFSAFKHIEDVHDLPPLYQSVFEWGCMSFASTLYHVLTSSDDATLNLTQLKRTHFLLPYRTMWGILKISNPMAMMKGIMDLFLAQPFGSRSLMQRILSGNMQEEVSECKKEIAEVEAVIGDPALCEKIRNYVFAPRAVVSKIFSEDEPYDITELGLVMDVLRSEEILPVLQPVQIKRVWDAQQGLEQEKLEKERLRALNKQNCSDSDVSDYSDDSHSSRSSLEDGSADEKHPQAHVHRQQQHHHHHHQNGQQQQEQHHPESNLIRQLQQLLVANLRIREKERLMELVFQGVTGEILKEIISIFYQPLVKVYKSANVADSMMDVKYFVDELIKVVEQAESDNGQGGPSGKPSAATLYLNLVRKHLPSFYKFVHAVHKQDDGIFHDLLEWIESIITFMRTGFGHARINYKTGEELRVGIDLDGFVKKTIDPAQWELIQKEAEELRVYFAEVKDRKREEVRQMAGLDRASHGHSSGSGDSGNAADQERVVKELRGLGMQQEDVDELEMINWEDSKDTNNETHQGEEDGGEFGLKVPKVPMIDTLRAPFVQLMNDVLFRTARE